MQEGAEHRAGGNKSEKKKKQLHASMLSLPYYKQLWTEMEGWDVENRKL